MGNRLKQKSLDEITNSIIYLAEHGYNCSQIMMLLALDQEGEKNPDLVRAMYGLGNGCGFFKETCGILTSSVCVLSWYAGKGTDNETESKRLMPMLQDLFDWFQGEVGKKHNGTRCEDILRSLAGTPEGQQVCGTILLKTTIKVNEILEHYNFR